MPEIPESRNLRGEKKASQKEVDDLESFRRLAKEERSLTPKIKRPHADLAGATGSLIRVSEFGKDPNISPKLFHLLPGVPGLIRKKSRETPG